MECTCVHGVAGALQIVMMMMMMMMMMKRPRNTKIGRKVAHPTGNNAHQF